MASEVVQLVSIILLLHAEFLYAQRFVRGCVFESSSRHRTNAAFTVRDIDFTLCTHYIYAAAQVDATSLTVVPADRSDEEGPTGLYKQFSDGKKQRQGTKTILSVGGYDVANDAAFVSLYTKDASFQSFSQNAVKYVKDQGFDGINIHWEPVIDNSGKTILPKLLRALRYVIDEDGSSKLLLTMTGCGLSRAIQTKYDIPELNKVVDYVFVDSKHLITKNVASFIAPVYYKTGLTGSFNSWNVSIHIWKYYSMPYKKLVMGVTIPGHYVKLKDPAFFLPGAQATEGLRGHIYNMDSRLAYPEICDFIGRSDRYFDPVQKSAYLVQGDKWVGYVDTVSLDARIWYLRAYGLAGLYFINMDEDDFSGTACNAGKFPLITYVRDKLNPVRPTPAPPETTTVEIDTTSETQTGLHRSTKAARKAPTTRKPVTEEQEKKSDSFTVLGYILLVTVFIIGHIIGHLFMRFTWQTFELYKQL